MARSGSRTKEQMRLEDLQAFLQLAEHGNLHRAADACGVTQSALSKTLARLEAENGLRLMERSGHGVALTQAGLSLQAHAQRVLRAMGDLRGDMAEQRQARAGAVRIGVLPHLMSTLLSPLLARFVAQRPLAQFSIEAHLSARLLALLQRAEVDLVLAARPDRVPRDLQWRSLGPLDLRVTLRADHPRRAQLLTLEDLSRERWALPATSLYLRHWLDERFTEAGLPAPRVAVESTASPAAFTELLRQSDLLGVMPVPLLRQAEGQGLAVLPGDALLWRRELGLFWRATGYLSPVCVDFRDAVLQGF